MAQRDKPLDATIDIVTPENISFRYRIAGPFRRLPAFIIDLLLRIGIWFALIFICGLIGVLNSGTGMLGIAFVFIVLFVMEWLYGGLLETFWNGQTIGKRVMGIRVLSTDGQPINGLQAMLRNILRFADMWPMVPLGAIIDDPQMAGVPIPTFVIGLVAPLLNKRFQRLGDLVCGTMVVIEEKSLLLETAKLEDPRVAQLAAELPSSFTVTQTMAKALATYVDRRHLFSPPRRREIARHIGEPLVQKFNLPPDTSYDLLVCALYHRTFLANQSEEVGVAEALEMKLQQQRLANLQQATILKTTMKASAPASPTAANNPFVSDGIKLDQPKSDQQ